jgi:hypothetical protein
MYQFKQKECKTIENVIERFPKKEFFSPYRSTIPLIILIKDYFELFQQVVGVQKIEKIIFEYETPVKKGRGLPSCSDALIVSKDKSIIIEAKRTEPKYEKVSAWDDNTENRKSVLSGWLEYIYEFTNKEISLAEVQHLPYQMIHRIASACSLKDQFAEVIYLEFDLNEEMKKYFIENLTECARLFNNKIQIKIKHLQINKKEKQKTYEKKWDAGSRKMHNEIIPGIISNDLMSFENPVVTEIKG